IFISCVPATLVPSTLIFLMFTLSNPSEIRGELWPLSCYLANPRPGRKCRGWSEDRHPGEQRLRPQPRTQHPRYCFPDRSRNQMAAHQPPFAFVSVAARHTATISRSPDHPISDLPILNANNSTNTHRSHKKLALPTSPLTTIGPWSKDAGLRRSPALRPGMARRGQ